MDQRTLRRTAAALCLTLAGGCATPDDRTRHDAARSGALQGAGYSLQIGSGIADNDAGSGILFTVLTAPIFGLVGAAVGAATTRK